MKTAVRELIAFLIECKAVQFGDFTLKSGEKSPFFVDLGCIASGRQLTFLGQALGRGISARFPDTTVLFGPPYKGIVLATAAAQGFAAHSGRDLGVCFARKEAKGHGEKGLFFGHKPAASDRTLIIDDVVSSGGTKIDAARALFEAFGVQATGVLVVLDRTRKGHAFTELPLYALVDILDLAGYLESQGDDRGRLLRRFYEGD
ncbi:MAG: orotate phosphoribosyltransferase [Deltaproteobacteria bacterium]|nr:orotate phosphoribosyltransferase [Deltaproteobacteria bacterium]